MTEINTERLVPAYELRNVAGAPYFKYFGPIAESQVRPPEVAVLALRQHKFPFTYVEITQHVQDEVRMYWSKPLENHGTSSIIDQLKLAHRNQVGDMLMLPRWVVSGLLQGMVDPHEYLEKYILSHERLTPVEKRILARLEMLPNVVIDKNEVLRASGCNDHPSVWVHVRRLRQKLDPNIAILQTVRGVGYYLEVRDVPSASEIVGVAAQM